MTNKKFSTGGLVLAGLAAYAYYKYTKMTIQEKDDIINNLKERGQKLYDEYVPQNVKDIIDQKNGKSTGAKSTFDESNIYNS